MNVKLAELRGAFDFVSAGPMTENEAYISRDSGRIYWCGPYVDDEEDLPDDLEVGSAYIAVPHKNELDLGRRLAFQFALECAPSLNEAVRDAFCRKGAYRRFKDLLDRHDMLEQWYEYEEAATVAALQKWCTENGIATDA